MKMTLGVIEVLFLASLLPAIINAATTTTGMTSGTGTTTSEPGTTTPVTSSSVPSTITVTAEQNMTSVGTTPTSSTFMTSSPTMNITMSDNQTSSTTVTTMAYGNDSSTMMTSTSETTTICLDGGCSGNISCLQELENNTCILTVDKHCYVYTNATDTFYSVGCKADCEETSQEGGTGNYTVTSDIYCCNENLCNEAIREIYSSAISFRTYCGPVYLLMTLFIAYNAFILN